MEERSGAVEGLEVTSRMVSPDGWHGRRVVVTGATGFVGSWLVRDLLARGAQVIALVRDADPQSELFRSGDIRCVSVVSGPLEDFWTLERAISEYEPDTIFHLGAQPIVGVAQRFPIQTFEANIRGTYNLLEACRVHSECVRRVVVASSDKAYGSHGPILYTEEMVLQARHPYEVSKSCAEALARTYHHTYGLPVVLARCGNIYGGGDLNWTRVVPGTIRALLRGERPVIRSDGSPVRDYLYVKDAVRAYLRLAQSLDEDAVVGEAFNFGGASPCTVLQMVALIQQLMKREDLTPDISNVARGEIAWQCLSSEKALRVLGWQPSFPLEAGLAESVAWYRGFLGAD